MYRILLLAAAAAAQNRRALVALYGLKNRSAGCARPAQHQNVVRPLEALGYAVDVWDVTIEPPEGAVVDKTPYAAGKTPCAVDACVHESQRAGDDAIDALCARADCRVDAVGYRANPRLVRNLIRQFYAEHALARALGQAQTYDVAAAVSEDVAVLRPLAPADVERAKSRDAVLACTAFDHGGVTNGYYVARPAALRRALSTFESLADALPTTLNYEGLLRNHWAAAGLRRLVFAGDRPLLEKHPRLEDAPFAKIRYPWPR